MLKNIWLVKILVVALTMVIMASAGLLLFSRANQSGFVRGYFWAERTWNEHWPLGRGKDAIREFAPKMMRIGILRPARIEVEPGISFLLDPRDFVSLTILRNGAWQPEVWESISAALSDGGVFLDVGAHIGYFSIKAAVKVGKTGRVVAFEPNPEILKMLHDNVTANKAQNVIVEPIACTDREQMLTFYASPIENTGASSLARANADISVNEPPRVYTVRGRSIDDVIRELNLARVDVIKIDVEGAEVAVLQGTVNTLKRFHPRVVVETVAEHLANFHTSVDDLTSLMRRAGYNRSKPLNPQKTDWEWIVQDPRDMVSMIRIADLSTAGQLLNLAEYNYRLGCALWGRLKTCGGLATRLRAPFAGRPAPVTNRRAGFHPTPQLAHLSLYYANLNNQGILCSRTKRVALDGEQVYGRAANALSR